jgi:hypothetical protein
MNPRPTKSAPPRLLPDGRSDRSSDTHADAEIAASQMACLARAMPAFARRFGR